MEVDYFQVIKIWNLLNAKMSGLTQRRKDAMGLINNFITDVKSMR
jgi:hypothetical protein